MSNISNLRDTITPKSDQLNADDLIGMNKIITVTGVTRGNAESPLFIHYQGDDGRPFKPCKSMRRIMIFAWGEDGNIWVGRSVSLYCDASVKYGGKVVGGIRINEISHIDKPINVNLTATRGVKKEYKIAILQQQQKPYYPQDKFEKSLVAMAGYITSNKMTAEQVITKCEQTGALNDEQRKSIRDLAVNKESVNLLDDELDD